VNSVIGTTGRHLRQAEKNLHGDDEASRESVPKLDLLILWLTMLYMGGYTAWVIDRAMAAL
jgi:hypothetical protein